MLGRHVAGALLLLATGEAAAGPCADDIASLDRQIEEKAKAAISISTGSKEIAGSREARALDARDRNGSGSSIPNAPAPGTPEAKAAESAAEAGAGGDRIMLAKASLYRARTLDPEGNGGCRDGIAEARAHLAE
jgi:hypothetical protein